MQPRPYPKDVVVVIEEPHRGVQHHLLRQGVGGVEEDAALHGAQGGLSSGALRHAEGSVGVEQFI